MDVIVGVDEAGRGSVTGPMVYGACFCPIDRADELKDYGFADSKKLSVAQREKLLQDIKSVDTPMHGLVDIIPASYLSAEMLAPERVSLNEISYLSAIGLIRSIEAQGHRIRELYVDTVGDPVKYANRLRRLFPSSLVTVESKADDTYPIVSAASICAKQARDASIEGLSMGCGYPGDETTKAWLRSNLDPVFGFSDMVRFSWSTSKRLLEDCAVSVDWEVGHSSFPSSTPQFFKSRKLSSVSQF